ncbi:MAG: outer membrane protein assembly factor BamA [Thermodesulfatator sp.]|nr:MAG: outer membrane protein assembly factor BamA [Thermodesulfatator sp.]
MSLNTLAGEYGFPTAQTDNYNHLLAPWLIFSIFLFVLTLFLPIVACAQDAQEPGPVSLTLFEPSYIGPPDHRALAGQIKKLLVAELEARGNIVKTSNEIIKIPGQARELLETTGTHYGVYGTVSLLGTVVSLDFYIVSTNTREKKPLVAFVQGPADKDKQLVTLLGERIEKKFMTPYMVAKVQVEGNKRVGTDAIIQNISTTKGQKYDPQKIARDIQALYDMGYFDDIEVDVEDSPEGKIVTFMLREKPAIRKILFQGNHEIKDDKLKEVMDLKPYSVIKEKALQENAEKIKALYAEEGYAGTTVTVSIKPVSGQAADVVFDINEGEKVHIKEIDFQGIKAFSADDLRSIMEVSAKKPWWTPSLRNIMGLIKGSAGVLKWDALERDLGRIAAYYHNHGYVDAKVGEPKVKREGADLYITIPVMEGDRYVVGKVDIKQEFFKDEKQLLSELEIEKQDYFSQEVLRKDIMNLTSKYSDFGFAHCTITPDIKKDPEKKAVNILLVVNRGPKVFFDRIAIAGNTRTRDKVIRRELRVMELEPFSGTGLKKSNDRLRRLGYFEDVEITPKPGKDEKHMDLDVKVKERPTGTFSIGAGYSSVDSLMLMGEISQRNFLGKGQTLSFKGVLGGSTQRFSLSFFEPYFRDTKFSLGVDLYNWRYDYSDYTKDSTGGALRFGYPLTDNLRFFCGARADYTDMSDISDNTSKIIQDSLDIKSTRSLNAGLSYDTRNRYFNPSRGWSNDIGVEYAGGILGGDAAFWKFQGTLGYYHAIWKEIIGHMKLGAGWVFEGNGGQLPVYDRFFLGGLDSIRGFKYGDVSPRDPETDERVGGEYMGYLQSELIFPIIQNMGLNGVVFYDAGNVWAKHNMDIGNLRMSVGGGVRWLSPMGPLRVEWGYNVAREPDDDKSNWEFRMGGNF